MNLLDGAVQMGAGLGVYGHQRSAGVGDLTYIVLGMHGHHVYIQRFLAYRVYCLDDGQSKRDVGHKHAVHHVHVQPVGCAAVYHLRVFAQPCKVGRQQ